MEILIEEYKINRSVRALAHIITEEHKNSGNMLPPVMICVLKGSFMFFTDLVKNIGVDCEIDFIRAKSYEDKVSVTLDLEIDLKGKVGATPKGTFNIQVTANVAKEKFDKRLVQLKF
jgi:hypoxanthine phosphoribosyltransferase